jgi:hypothetical protein
MLCGSSTTSASPETPIRPAIIRAGLCLALLTAISAFAFRASAQATPTNGAIAMRPPGAAHAPSMIAAPPVTLGAPVAFAPVPFAVGEELTYKASFKASIFGISAGSARMRVDGIEMIRGRPAYHVLFSIDGGVPLFRVHDRYESWIDVQTLSSLRHHQEIAEGRYRRTTTYEIFPERASYQKDNEPMEASVANPLDDGSFIYAVRAARLRVGETRRDDRYFRPDRNPVVLTGLRNEEVTVTAGTFATVVVRPSIKTNGLFSENGDAQIWFSDDANRYPVQLKTKFSKFSFTLTLQTVTAGDTSANERLLTAAMLKE